jgi:hypothetical protein
MTVTESADHKPRRSPTSREVNEAIEMLKRAGLSDAMLGDLENWNRRRIVERALEAGTHEELANLFVGLPKPETDFSE